MTGTFTVPFLRRTMKLTVTNGIYNAGKLTGADGMVREKRRRPSKHARIFGPITGIYGTEFIPYISRVGFRLPGKHGQNTGAYYPGVLPV